MPLLILEVLCKKLGQEQDGREDGLLFDIVAGTSIGAMNAAIFVSEFLETQNWNKAAEKLQKFWTLMHSQSFAYIAISKDMEFLRTLKSKEDDQSIKLVTNFSTVHVR